MTNEARYTRRRMVQATGTAAVLGLAGCSEASTSDGGSGSEATSTSGSDDHDEGGDDHGGEGDDHDEGGDDHGSEGDDHDEGGDDHGGGGHEDDGHDTVDEPTATAEVAVNTTDNGEAHFNPHVTWVETDGTVTWVLESGSHTATAYHPENNQPQLVPAGTEPWDSGMLSEAGETFEHTFETEGVYHYYCAPHETGGMIGSVIVGEPDAHGQPALDDPPEDKPAVVREKIVELNEMCNEVLGHGHD